MLLVTNPLPAPQSTEIYPRPLTAKDEIIAACVRYGVAWQTWGTKKPYTIDDLVDLLADCEATLTDTGNGLVLEVWISAVVLWHLTGHQMFELHESYVEFLPGGVREERGFNGFAETRNKGETAEDGAHRAVREEPGNSEPLLRDPRSYLFSRSEEKTEKRESHDKWHGLTGVWHRTIFTGLITNGNAYKKEGYQEVGGRKIIHLEWVCISPADRKKILGI